MKRDHKAAMSQLDARLDKDRQDLLRLTIDPLKKTSEESSAVISQLKHAILTSKSQI